MFELSVVICDGEILLGFNNNVSVERVINKMHWKAILKHLFQFIMAAWQLLCLYIKSLPFGCVCFNMLSLQHTPIFK